MEIPEAESDDERSVEAAEEEQTTTEDR